MCYFDEGNINSHLAQFALKNDFFREKLQVGAWGGKLDSAKWLGAGRGRGLGEGVWRGISTLYMRHHGLYVERKESEVSVWAPSLYCLPMW